MNLIIKKHKAIIAGNVVPISTTGRLPDVLKMIVMAYRSFWETTGTYGMADEYVMVNLQCTPLRRERPFTRGTWSG
jgi:hypothetical protein